MAQKTLNAVFKATDGMTAIFNKMTASHDRLIQSMSRIAGVGNAAMANLANGANGAASAMANMTGVSTGAASSMASNAVIVDQYGNAISGVSVSAEEMTNAIEKTTETTTQLEESIEKTAKAPRELGDEMEKAGRKTEDFGRSTQKAISGLDEMIAGLGLIEAARQIKDAFVSVMGAAIEFGSAITGVYKTVDGTEAQLSAISAGIRQLALDIPATTTEISGVAEAAGQLGVATSDVLDFTNVMIGMGEATNLSADTAATTAARFANITKMPAEYYENWASTIVALGNNFATTEAEIAAMATRMASAATMAGFAQTDILAMAASLSSVGVEAEAGGSAMARMISMMQVAVETGSADLQSFANVAGVTIEEFTSMWDDSAVDALYAFISGLNDVERTGSTATVMLEEMGISEIRLSNAIKGLANDNGGLKRSIDMANEAWNENTALTNEVALRYGTLESQVQLTKNAHEELRISIGEALSEAFANLNEAWRDTVQRMSEFVKKNPEAVKAIAAVVAGIAVFAAAIVAATVVMKIFNAVASMNPLFLVAGALAAAAIAAGIYAASIKPIVEEYDTLTLASREMYDEINRLESELKESEKNLGADNDKTLAIRYQLSELRGEYERTKETVDEFTARIHANAEAQQKAVQDHKDAVQGIEDEKLDVLSLIGKYDELTKKPELTLAEYDLKKRIAEQISEAVPDLADHRNVLGQFDVSTDFMKGAANNSADYKKYKTNVEDLANQSKMTEGLEQNRAAAIRNLAASLLKKNELEAQLQTMYDQGMSNTFEYDEIKNKRDNEYENIRKLRGELDIQNTAYESNRKQIDDLTKSTEAYAGTAENATAATADVAMGQEAAMKVIMDTQEALVALGEEWDTAYQSVYDSLSGMVDLTEKFKPKEGITLKSMFGNAESWKTAFADYESNLKVLEGFGISNEVLQRVQGQGMEAGSAMAEAIAKGLTSGKTTKEEVNEKLGGWLESIDPLAKELANIQTNIEGKMGLISSNLRSTVQKEFNLSEQAGESARSTMDAFIQSIEDAAEGAGQAAQTVADAIQAVFNSLIIKPPTIPVPQSVADTYGGYTSPRPVPKTVTDVYGYARGTTNSAWAYKAGEEGEELIINAPGSQVFTASETSDIMANALEYANNPKEYDPPERMTQGKETGGSAVKVDVGGLTVNVQKGESARSITRDVLEQVEPYLLAKFEEALSIEGDGAYDF